MAHDIQRPGTWLGALAGVAVLAALPTAAIGAPPGTLRLSDVPPGWQPLPSAPWTAGLCGFRFAPPVRADFIGPQPSIATVSAGARIYASTPAAHRTLAFNLRAARACRVDGYAIRVIAFPRTGDESFAMRLSQKSSLAAGATMVFFRHRDRVGAVSVIGSASSSFVLGLARKGLHRLG